MCVKPRALICRGCTVASARLLHTPTASSLVRATCGPAESVAERSEAVNSKLQLRRDQIEELSQVKNLLTKLQAVFDLPRRLRTALDRGALEIAADAYADAAPLLKRYGHKVCVPVSPVLIVLTNNSRPLSGSKCRSAGHQIQPCKTGSCQAVTAIGLQACCIVHVEAPCN